MGGAKYFIFLEILFLSLDSLYGLPKVDPLVETPSGIIKGLSASNGDYSMFLGIPYATVNTSNPFGPSIPHPRFETTFEAFDDSAICPQRNEFTNELTGSLDCLHLNVYVPNTASSNNRLPVMVWLYEGGFSRGFAGRFIYGPKFLVRHDVLLVTINYRLGPYGFMCLDTPDVPGNQGLKDQLTALRWIKKNIESFGGDSEKVTLFGESAGSASSEFHFLFTTENLFQNIILQSGAVIVGDSDINVPMELAAHLGYETEDVNDALKFLSTANTDLVIAASLARNIRIAPCVEKEFENVERLITEHPLNRDSPNAESTSIMIGVGSQEGVTMLTSLPPMPNKNAFNPFYVMGQFFDFTPEYLDIMVQNVQQFYIGDDDIGLNVLWELIDYLSDFGFTHPAIRQSQKYLASGTIPIYFYMLSYNGNRNFYKRRFGITAGGVAHTDDLGYLFDVSFFEETPTAEDQLIIDRMTTLWTNFAKYSNPTPNVTELLPVLWPTMTKEKANYLNIDKDMEILQRPHHDRVAYWDLFYKLNQKYEPGYQPDK